MADNYWKERSKPYAPGQTAPFKVSRSKIELFMQCPRCFWLDVRLKITRPNTPPFNINKAIDGLFKKEFDSYRSKKQPHPLMVEFGVDAIPYEHDSLNKWRENFVGVVGDIRLNFRWDKNAKKYFPEETALNLAPKTIFARAAVPSEMLQAIPAEAGPQSQAGFR